ncbi:MAG: undecaprenyl-diphosphatase UppP [Candidatus Nanopelagicaceae bacterium]
MLEAIFLGILQGLTEFLPISSSAHIRLAGEFLPSAQDPGATFTAIMQIGTEIAVLLYFRNEISRIFSAAFSWLIGNRFEVGSDELKSANLAFWIVIGSIPIFIFGFVGQSYIRENFRSLYLIAATLIVFGLLLGWLDRVGKKTKNLDLLNTRDGMSYGFAQSLALIPGVSRSGATIAMGRLLGYSRESALRYSFLLAIPAVLGSGCFELINSFSEPTNKFSILETGVATFTAFVIGYLVIAWLMRFVQYRSFMPFVIYRVFLGSVIFLLLSTGQIS